MSDTMTLERETGELKCEPCRRHGQDFPAVGTLGPEHVPVCDFHHDNTWGLPRP